MQILNIEDIKYHNTKAGYYFFSPAAMTFFDSIIYEHVRNEKDYVYFITSERFRFSLITERCFKVRAFHRFSCRILSEDFSCDSLGKAKEILKDYAYNNLRNRRRLIIMSKKYKTTYSIKSGFNDFLKTTPHIKSLRSEEWTVNLEEALKFDYYENAEFVMDFLVRIHIPGYNEFSVIPILEKISTDDKNVEVFGNELIRSLEQKIKTTEIEIELESMRPPISCRTSNYEQKDAMQKHKSFCKMEDQKDFILYIQLLIDNIKDKVIIYKSK